MEHEVGGRIEEPGASTSVRTSAKLGAKLVTSTTADRLSLWFLTAVFAGTLVMSAQTLWWVWHEPVQIDSRSRWDILHTFTFFLGREPWFRWPLVIGGVAVLAIFAGVALRRRWGISMTLPCSMVLLSLMLGAWFAARAMEPRQFVSRSIYVQTARTALIIALLTHGTSALLAIRLLRRQILDSTTVIRVAMGVLCVPLAALPAVWIGDGARNPGSMAALIFAPLAVIAAALVMIAWPRRASAMIVLGAIGLALVSYVTMLVIFLGEKPRRHHLYSENASFTLVATSLAVPALLALLGLVLIIRQHLNTHQPAPTADS